MTFFWYHLLSWHLSLLQPLNHWEMMDNDDGKPVKYELQLATTQPLEEDGPSGYKEEQNETGKAH